MQVEVLLDLFLDGESVGQLMNEALLILIRCYIGPVLF